MSTLAHIWASLSDDGTSEDVAALIVVSQDAARKGALPPVECEWVLCAAFNNVDLIMNFLPNMPFARLQSDFLEYIEDIWHVQTALTRLAFKLHYASHELLAPLGDLNVWNAINRITGRLWRGTPLFAYYASSPMMWPRFSSIEAGIPVIDVPITEPGRSLALSIRTYAAEQSLQAGVDAILQDASNYGKQFESDTSDLRDSIPLFSPGDAVRVLLSVDMSKWNVKIRAYYLWCLHKANVMLLQQPALLRDLYTEMVRYGCGYFIDGGVCYTCLPTFPIGVLALVTDYATPNANEAMKYILSLRK